MLPGGESIWQVVNWVVSLALTTLLFALMFKVVPDVKIKWRDVWVGAVLTAVLFTLGKFLLALYIGKSSTTSAYGAAGSLVALVIWVYYSSQVVFVGAEFTQAYARHFGAGITPSENAVSTEEPEPKAAPPGAMQGATCRAPSPQTSSPPSHKA
ncbi:MAG TPA: YihY/virulence factor BrkB family protein, partial [Polyangiaceae bacterium]|nr:YihY/virulence factor BrkB family protein [Polyangiaceae bacterium]